MARFLNKIKNYNNLIKFINENRQKKMPEFEILTTAQEIIIINKERKQLRLQQELWRS